MFGQIKAVMADANFYKRRSATDGQNQGRNKKRQQTPEELLENLDKLELSSALQETLDQQTATTINSQNFNSLDKDPPRLDIRI